MNVLLYLAAFFVPLGAKILSVSVGPFKLSPFRLCIILAIMCHCMKGGVNLKLTYRKNSTGYALAFMTLWIVYAVISLLWARDTAAWFKNVYFLCIGVASIALFCHYFTTIKLLKKAAVAFELGVLVQGLIGWYEIFSKNYLFLEMTEKNVRSYLSGISRIPIAMQNNPNNFATMMFCGAAVAGFLLINETRKYRKSVFFLMGVNCIVLLFLTTSRANILGVLVTICIFLLIGNRKKLALLMALLIVVLCIPQTTEYISHALQFRFAEVNGSDSLRLGLIKTGLMYTYETFGFGTGAGQIEYWIHTYGSPYNVGSITNIHNWWIELISNYGLFIFIGYIVFYLKMMFTFKKKGNFDKESPMAKTGTFLFSVLVGYIVACISPSSLVNLEWSWVFMGLLITYMSIVEKNSVLATNESTLEMITA